MYKNEIENICTYKIVSLYSATDLIQWLAQNRTDRVVIQIKDTHPVTGNSSDHRSNYEASEYISNVTIPDILTYIQILYLYKKIEV